jgi:4-amino-4-deoxy-L-arabinose transferase-like glycosyltransferase
MLMAVRNQIKKKRGMPEIAPAFRTILVCVCVVYLIGAAAEPISTIDDQVMLTAAMNLVQNGKLTLPQRFAEQGSGRAMFGRATASGEVYVKYPPGYPVLLAIFLAPARAAGLLFGSLAADLVLCLPSILALLATALLLWLSCIRMGFSPAAANIAASGFAVGSYAWPYAGVNFSEPLQTLCVTAAFFCLVSAWNDEPRWRKYFLAGGLALGYGVLVKSSLGLIMPAMALGALWGWWKKVPVKDAFLRVSLFAAPSVLAGIYLLLVNSFMFGSASDFGYSGETFRASASHGFLALTAGWDKGMLWFAPLTILVPLGIWRLRNHPLRWAAASLVVSSAAYYVLISRWYGYRGGNCWGPRLLMPVLPLLMVLAAGALYSVWARRLGVALVVLGIGVNTLGVLINYQAYYIAVASAPGKPDWNEAGYSQIRGHLWLARVMAASGSPSRIDDTSAPWTRPPWIEHHPEAIPARYTRFEEPLPNPWPLRLTLEKPWKRRADLWYLRSLMEVAMMKYQDGDFSGALKLMESGLRIDPEYEPLVAAEGLVYYSLRQLPRALARFERSVALNPEYELGWFGRGICLESAGNREGAAASYEALLKVPLRSLNRKDIEQRLANLGKR